MKKHRTVSRLALAFAVVAGLAPMVSHAEHCTNTIIFSGVSTGQPNPSAPHDVRQGFNLGVEGCTIDDTDETFNTNYTTPGASSAWAASTLPGPESEVNPKPTGTMTINGGTPITMNYLWSAVRTRWEAQSVDLPVGPATIVATAGDDSITYTKLA